MNPKHMRRAGAMMMAAVVATSLVSAGAPPAADPKAAFERLKGLTGDWDGSVTRPDGPKARVEFRLAGNSSAVVERLFPGTDHEMISIYHMDGADLVLTHYCAMANQPRMKLVEGGAEGDLVFDFAGGSNIDPNTTIHMHAGRIAIKGKDRYDADWQVFQNGKLTGNNVFFMSRAAAK